MRSLSRLLICFGIMATLVAALPSPGSAVQEPAKTPPRNAPAVQFPLVLLEHWQNTAMAERYAFLAGFLSMLELERSWQGQALLPVTQSTVGTWVKGLENVTLHDMDTAINQYLIANPNAQATSVIEVLGITYVRPAMTQAERDAAAKHYESLRSAAK